LSFGGYHIASATLYYYLFLVLLALTVTICHRLQDSRIGRAWMAIPDDEVVFGGIGHIPGVVLGAIVLTALPGVLRYIAGPLQAMTDGRLNAGILRPLLISLAMIITMLVRPHGLWPAPEHGKSRPQVGQ